MFKKSITPTTKLRPKSPKSNLARYKYWAWKLLIYHLALLISNCGLDVEDSTPPSAPIWVQKSLPEDWPERGIDAHESGGIILEWDANPPDEDVQRYLILRSEYFSVQDSLGEYEIISSVEAETGNIGEYIDRATATNTRYYYILVAKAVSGNQSTSSDTLNYMRMDAINVASLYPNGPATVLSHNRKVQWGYGYDIAMENYTITILNIENDIILRRELRPDNYICCTEYFTIPDTVILLPGNVYKWRVDMGAQYVAGRETAGSESLWATFLYNAP